MKRPFSSQLFFRISVLFLLGFIGYFLGPVGCTTGRSDLLTCFGEQDCPPECFCQNPNPPFQTGECVINTNPGIAACGGTCDEQTGCPEGQACIFDHNSESGTKIYSCQPNPPPASPCQGTTPGNGNTGAPCAEDSNCSSGDCDNTATGASCTCVAAPGEGVCDQIPPFPSPFPMSDPSNCAVVMEVPDMSAGLDECCQDSSDCAGDAPGEPTTCSFSRCVCQVCEPGDQCVQNSDCPAKCMDNPLATCDLGSCSCVGQDCPIP